jgi:hypothetical protein
MALRLALAWEEGYAACYRDEIAELKNGKRVETENPYKESEVAA